jgi:hypothetical protein
MKMMTKRLQDQYKHHRSYLFDIQILNENGVQASVLGIPHLAIFRGIVASKDPINAQALRLSSDATVTQDWLSRGPQRHDSTDAPLRHFGLSLTLLR